MKFFFSVILVFISFTTFSKTLSIQGNKKLSLEDIQQLSKIDIYSQDLNENEINKLINDLYDSDLIDNLNLLDNTDKYVLTIFENIIIKDIFINGNIFINDENILSNINSKNNTLLNKDTISSDINIIKNLLSAEGFNQTSIVVSTEKYSEDRVNLIFEINEGEKSYISSIRIIGNSFFSENFLLSKLNSKSNSFFNIFDKSSNLSKDLMNFDQNTIKNLYLEKGFFNVQINYVLQKKSSNSYILNFFIEENERFKIRNISYDDFLISKFKNILDPVMFNFKKNIEKEDFFFDKKIVSKHIVELSQSLYDNNIYNINISSFDSFGDNFIDLKFIQNIEETKLINKININGNQITKDKVIRSKFNFEPGDIFIKDQVDEQLNNLKKYRYINDAKYSFSSYENSDLNIDLDENIKTGSFFFAATGSSDLGLGLKLGINDNNILGSGNQINADFSLNSENVIFDFNFIHYPYLSSTLRNNYSVSNTESDYTSSFGFKTREQKISSGINFDYSDKISMSVSLSYKSIDGNTPKFNDDTAINDNIGLFNDININYSINYDSTNNFLYPSNGYYNSLSLEYSPENLSDNTYLKTNLVNKNYFEISEGGSFLFNINNFGIVESLNSNNIKTFDSYSLGGSSFNGFDYRGVGPTNSNNIYLGGNKFYTSKIGIGTNFFTKQQDNLYLKLFLTTGSIWDSDYSSSDYKQRTSLGGSLDFITPIGPISISYAVPLEKSNNDKARRFDFRIGGIF